MDPEELPDEEVDLYPESPMLIPVEELPDEEDKLCPELPSLNPIEEEDGSKENECMTVDTKKPPERFWLNSKSGKNKIMTRREPVPIILKRRDGSIFTPMSQNMINNYKGAMSILPQNITKQDDDAMKELLQTIANKKFVITKEGKQSRVNLEDQNDVETLVKQHGVNLFFAKTEEDDEKKAKEDDPREVTAKELTCFDPGEHVEFSMADLGLSGSLPSNPGFRAPELRYFPIFAAGLKQAKERRNIPFEICVRIPSPLMGAWIKTPFLMQLIEQKPWPLTSFSTNILLLYDATVDLLNAGLKFIVDPCALTMETFLKGNADHEIINRYNSLGYFHLSHYQPATDNEDSPNFWEAFPDPFSLNLPVDSIGMSQKCFNLMNAAYSLWFERMVDEWMIEALPNADLASDIIYHWWCRVWILVFYPRNSMKAENLSTGKITFSKIKRLAQMMVDLGGMTKETIRYMVLCWLFYELQYALLFEQHRYMQQFSQLRYLALGKCATSFNLHERLSVGDERALYQELHRLNVSETINTLNHYENYLLRRSYEGPDIYKPKWTFLMTQCVYLSTMELVSPPEEMDMDAGLKSEEGEMETSENGDVVILDAPLKAYVPKEMQYKSNVYWYREAFCREAMMNATEEVGTNPATGETTSCYRCTVNTEEVWHDEDIPEELKVKDATHIRVFNYAKLHQRPGDQELLFPKESYRMDGVFYSTNQIAWSPTMFLMRHHWNYLDWRIQSDWSLTIKISQDVTPTLLHQLPDLIRLEPDAQEKDFVSQLVERFERTLDGGKRRNKKSASQDEGSIRTAQGKTVRRKKLKGRRQRKGK